MNLSAPLPPEIDSFRDQLREFVIGELRPHSEEWEAEGAAPRSVFEKLGKLGLLTTDPRSNAAAAEELPRCETMGLALAVLVQSNLTAPLLEKHGTPEQLERWLPLLLGGKALAAMAVSEPSAGSDVSSIAATARSEGKSYLLSGDKTYITCAAYADLLIVAAKHADGAHENKLSLFLVPAGSAGVRVEKLALLGMRTSGAGKVRLEDCRVPASAILGGIGAGFSLIQEGLDRERLIGGIAAVAWASHCLEKTISYARDRKAFGQSISRFQAVRHQLAESAAELEAARQLNYRTFERWVGGETVAREICMIKLFTYRAAQRTIERCLQIHGAAGYLDDSWTSRFYRDARALTIAAGTPEIMCEMIASYLRL